MTDTVSEEVRTVCRDGQLSETVISAVAEAKGVEPLDLEPLYTAVDPDALDRLFQPAVGSPTPLNLQFAMADCRVTVRSDSEVTVTLPATTERRPKPVAPSGH